MGLIERFRRAGKALLALETRDEVSWAALASGIGYGAAVSARVAENLSAVLACTNVIGTSLGSIPALVYRTDEAGRRIELSDHPLTRLTRLGVSEMMTWPDFIEHLVSSELLHGNGLAEVKRTPSGELVGLEFIPWSQVSVVYLSSGRLAFDVSDPRSGRSRRLLQSEVLHLRDRTDDGLLGRSRLSRAADTVAGVSASNIFAKAFLEQGAGPSGVIEVPGTLTKDKRDDLQTAFNNRNSGAANAGKTLVLDGGMTWKAAQISPEDAELLETRKFGVEEICRLFQVPPPLVQDYSHNTFTNSETAGRWFAMFTLTPMARKIEAEFARSVFPADQPLHLELDLSGFLRGDPKTRWDAHKIAIDAGVLDAEEVRQVEGWNPRETKPGDPAKPGDGSQPGDPPGNPPDPAEPVQKPVEPANAED